MATTEQEQDVESADAAEESEAADTELRAVPSRIAADFELLSAIGAEAGGGISRIPFSQEERTAHDLVSEWMVELGLSVRTDSFGNTIGTMPGTDPKRPAIGFGSHLDSVPHGGRFDGAIGVLAALEVIRMFAETDITTAHPLMVIAFASEEGARFGEPCLGSKAVAGVLQEADMERLRDANGITLAQAMRALSFDPLALPQARWAPNTLAAFLELHIEQARSLEEGGERIGLVDAIAGNTRIRLVIKGRQDHSGGTPMSQRRDALAAAAEVILAAESIANEPRRRATVATVGRLHVYPNSITTIPGDVEFYLDVRDVDSDRQRLTTNDIVTRAEETAARRGLRCEWEVVSDTSPVVLPKWLRDLTTGATDRLNVPHRVTTSGAGHDAGILSRAIPAAMLFVPSRDGLSHCPEEWTSMEDIAIGARALAESIRDIDTFLTKEVAE